MEAVAASSYSLVVVGSIYLLTSFGDETLFPERWKIPSRKKNATLLIMKMQTWLLMIINEVWEWVIALNYYSKLAYLGRRPSRRITDPGLKLSHLTFQELFNVQPFYFFLINIFSENIATTPWKKKPVKTKKTAEAADAEAEDRPRPSWENVVIWTKCKQMNWVDP